MEQNIEYNIYFNDLSKLLSQFWRRWRQEYLSELRESHKIKRKSKSNTVNVGDIVIIHNDNLPRSLWRIGRIENLLISKDSEIRGAEVRTPSQKVLKRPINKLYPIEYAKFQNYSPLENKVNETENRIESEYGRNDRRPRRQSAVTGELRRKMEQDDSGVAPQVGGGNVVLFVETAEQCVCNLCYCFVYYVFLVSIYISTS